MNLRTTLAILLTIGFFITAQGQSTYVVNAVDDIDDGNCDAIHCSLREAIHASNSDNHASTIEFAIGIGNTEVIMLDNALPILEEDSTVINGMTQTGAPGGVRINCANIGAQQQDIIRIHGNYAELYGLEIYNYTVSEDINVVGTGSLIGVGGIFVLVSPTTVKIGAANRGNILHSTFRTRSTAASYANGIAVHSGTEIIIQGNRIGTNYEADSKLPLYGEGIRIDENNFGETIIGGSSSDEGNIIGASSNGIGIYGGDGEIKGNSIGVSPDKLHNLGNRENGIFVRDGTFYDIGDSNTNEGNLVFHNQNGILVISNFNQYVGGNEIAFNSGSGLISTSCPDCLFEYNIIHHNSTGINMTDQGMTQILVRFNEIFENLIGTTYTYNDASRDIPITQNSHYCNDIGITLSTSGTPAFSPITFNSVTNTQVIGLANPGATIEIFEQDTTGCPDFLSCQGKFYLGNSLADASTGLWSFNFNFKPGHTYAVTQTIPKKLTSSFQCFVIPECSTVVTTPADSGPGSLREAIICANANPGPDTITFDIMGGIPRTITPLTLLPILTDDATVIDASTQPNNFPMNSQITLDCNTLVGPGSAGLRIEGDHCEIYGLVITQSAGAGLTAGTNLDPINHLVIGDPDRYNIFSENNLYGVNIVAGDEIKIQSNYFGTNETFSPPFVTTNTGCLITLKDTSSQILVGGSRFNSESNYFGFCEQSGCELIGEGIGGSASVLGNFFGTDNGQIVNASNGGGLPGKGALSLFNLNSQIGDGTDDHANVFAYNSESGIFGTLGDHLISNNSFYCNRNGGIDHTSNGQMGNSQVSPPVITNANNTLIQGTSQGNGLVEVYFHDDQICTAVPCQGRHFLGTAATDPNTGEWSLTGPFIPMLNIGDFVTATFANNDQTSEFSECVQVCPDLLITVTNGGPYCPGDEVELNSTVNSNSTSIVYDWTGPNGFTSDIDNPLGNLDSGLYILILTVDGCEYAPLSTRVIFQALDTINLDTTICSGQNLVIGGETFDENRTTGQVRISSNVGCDSVINVSLSFAEESMNLIQDTLCADDTRTINGVTYSKDQPQGRDTISRGGCDSIIIVDLSFFDEKSSEIRRELCFGDFVIVNGQTYDENRPSGTEIITTSDGCDSTITIELTFGNARVNQIDTTICSDDQITINGTVYSANNLSGSDTIPMGSSNGCDSVIAVEVQLAEVAMYDLDTILCPKGSITVNGILYDQFYMEGTDTIFGGSRFGCDSILHVRIRYPDPVFSLDTITPNCDGSQPGQIIIQNIEDIPGPFSYSLNGSPFRDIGQFPWTIDALDEGKYDIIFMDGKGCRHIVQVELSTNGEIDFDVMTPIEIVLGDSAVLNFSAAFQPDSIIWMDQNGTVICKNCNEITVSPITTTTYFVTLYKDGCSSSKSITIEVDNSVKFYVPNAFSPNGDGINDFLNVYSDQPGVIVQKLTIYDRWGEIIYSEGGYDASAHNTGWNGTFNGEAVANGVYVYHFEINVGGNRIEHLKGSVTVVR